MDHYTAQLRQGGAALVSAFFVLIALLVIGVSAAHVALSGERAARADRDHQLALQSAESALVDAERDIEGGIDPASVRAAMFSQDGADGFVDGCGKAGAANVGLCRLANAPSVPAWQASDLSAGGSDAASTEYGTFTGAEFPAGKGSLPAQLPRYIIELMPYALAGADASERTGNFYRITAIGFGANEHTHVVLQSFYLKPAREDSAP